MSNLAMPKRSVCRTAATPAIAPPMTKTSMMIRSLLTPISAAVSGSWATARTPRPSRVRFTNLSSAIIMISADDDDDDLDVADRRRRRW